MSRPDSSEFPAFYKPYLDILPTDGLGLSELLNSSLEACLTLLGDLRAGKEDYRYAEGKWSIKELLQHIIDAERVFAYRALRFARHDSSGLAGFDENLYVETSRASERDLASLLEEFHVLRKANMLMFESFDDEALMRTGHVDGSTFSTRALGFIICGHVMHHLKVIEERYLE